MEFFLSQFLAKESGRRGWRGRGDPDGGSGWRGWLTDQAGGLGWRCGPGGCRIAPGGRGGMRWSRRGRLDGGRLDGGRRPCHGPRVWPNWSRTTVRARGGALRPGHCPYVHRLARLCPETGLLCPQAGDPSRRRRPSTASHRGRIPGQRRGCLDARLRQCRSVRCWAHPVGCVWRPGLGLPPEAGRFAGGDCRMAAGGGIDLASPAFGPGLHVGGVACGSRIPCRSLFQLMQTQQKKDGAARGTTPVSCAPSSRAGLSMTSLQATITRPSASRPRARSTAFPTGSTVLWRI